MQDINLCTRIVYESSVYGIITTRWDRLDDFLFEVDGVFAREVLELIKNMGKIVTVGIRYDKYLRFVPDAMYRIRFIAATVKLIEKYGFDGLDLNAARPMRNNISRGSCVN